VYTNTNDDHVDQGFRNFNLSVPAGSTIDGIEVLVEAKQEGPTCQLQARLSWNNGSNHTVRKTLVPGQSDGVLTYGNPTDTWGRTWTAGNFSNANFKVELRLNDPDNICITQNRNDSLNHDIFVDQVQVKVHYTAPETDATVIAHKIVCNDESLLPNWGLGAANVTSTTAQDFVTANSPNCWFAPNWSFQWGVENATNPGDDFYGEA